MTPITHAEFTIERRYGCTPAQTFAAFADPELRSRWFANPTDGWEDFEWELDFRVGGGERSAGGRPDGGRHNEYRSRFHDIVDDERIVLAYDLFHDRRLVSVSLVTVTIAPDDGLGATTLLRHTEQAVYYDDAAAAAEREHGTGILLDRLPRAFPDTPAEEATA